MLYEPNQFMSSRQVIFWVVAAISLLSLPLANAQGSDCTGPRTAGELRDHLWAGVNSTYDKRTRPGFAQWAADKAAGRVRAEKLPPPDKVQHQMKVLSVKEVDQKRGEFQLMAWIRQKWADQRLAYFTEKDYGCFPDKVRQGFSAKDMEGIWKPDISIENEVKRSDISSAFWIYPTGVVVYARYVTVTLSCSMDLQKFPRDVQQCYMRVGTWLEDANDVVLSYYDDLPPVEMDRDGGDGGASEWKFNVSSSEFEANTATQAESILLFNFKLSRIPTHYIDFVFMPAVLFVTIGWASFFVSRAAAPARVGMAMICFLTNVNFIGSQLQALPRLSNSVFLLKFLTISEIFTFYTILEYVICNFLMRIDGRVQAAHKKAAEAKHKKFDAEEGQTSNVKKITTDYEDLKQVGLSKYYLMLLNEKGQLLINDTHVENLSRIGYPISYIITIIVTFFLYSRNVL